jgi:hypothetical protein
MKKAFWVEILVGGIIIATLGYLVVTVVQMSGTLGRVDANQTSTAERVNRIALALPDVGVRVAREEVLRAFQAAVLSTTPTQAADGNWQTTVTVLDTQASKKWTLPIRLTSKDDRQAVYALVGAGVDADRASATLYRLQEYSRLAGLDSAIPHYVDVKASFVLYNTNGEEFIKKIASAAGAAYETSFDMKVEDYASLVKALKERQEAFKTPKK